MAVFLDQEGAFDITPHEDILYKLARMGIQGPTLTWIQGFLQGRSFHVAVGASVSTPYSILRGVPQGHL